MKSARYQIWLDGKLVERHETDKKSPLVTWFDAGQFARKLGGGGHYVQIIATDLDTAVEHAIEIEPLFDGPDQELRLESLCVAGAVPADPAGGQ